MGEGPDARTQHQYIDFYIDVKLARREGTMKYLGKTAFLNDKIKRHGTCVRVFGTSYCTPS